MSISPTFSCSTNPTSSLTPSFSSEKSNPKAQNIQNQITSLISIELYHLDTDEIASNYNSLFPEQTESQSDFIKSLCRTISNVKKATISSVNSFLSDNAKSIKINDNYLSAFNAILMEVKTFIKLSKVKFKQINETLQLLNLNLNSLSEYVKMGKISYALDKIGKIDEIKGTFQNSAFSLEEQQNKFYDSIKLIFQKNKIELSLNIVNTNSFQNTNNNSTTNNASIFKAKTFLSHYTTNHKRNHSKANGINDLSAHIRQFSANKKTIMNTSINNETNFLSHSIDNVKNIKKNLSPMTFSNQNNTITNSNELINKNQNDSVSLYKKKNKEYLATIERLKASLKNETEAKNALHSEISKLKQQILISYSTANTKSSNKVQTAQKEIQLNSLSTKITKVIEMVVSFSYSMNTLRDSLFKKKSNVIDPKNDYNKLRAKLVQISNDLINAGKNISKYYDSVEESLNQSTSNNSNIENSFNGKASKLELYETLLKQNSELKEENNELREQNQQLSNKIITFRNDDVKKCEKNVCNTITSEHDNYDKIVEENKMLKSQLSSMMLLNKNENCKQDENFNNENFALKKELFDIKKKTMNEITELKQTISKQKNEIAFLQSTKENKDECDFKLLKEQYEKNLSEIKQTYTDIVNDKNQSIEKLTKDNITLNTEINELKEKVANFETDYRKQKIVYESSISNLKNEKVSLELKLKNVTNDSSGNVVNNNDNEYEDKIKKLNAFIENQKIQIKHLNEIIISKDKIFETINSNSSNATNSDTIEQLQNKLLEDSRTINKLKQEINEKNNQIALITDNHQNDLNELNTSIILLKSKIAKLQEENISLSYSQRSQA